MDRLAEAIERLKADDRFSTLLVEDSYAQAGPFDGACLICAKAIVKACGGELVRIISDLNGGQTEHYGVRLDGWIYDFNGPHEGPKEWIDAFGRTEVLDGRELNYAEGYQEGGEMVEDPRIEKKLASLIQATMFGPPATIGADSSSVGEPHQAISLA